MHLPEFGVESWLNKYENEARYDIANVTVQPISLKELCHISHRSMNSLMKEIRETRLDYGWIEGSPEFKKLVSSLYVKMKPENILQTNGATGANLLVLSALIQPGDHVVAHYPSYQQLYDLPKALGANLDYWPIKEELGWLPDIQELKRLVQENTKLIIINNAHNPSGALMDDAYLQEIIDIASSCGAYVLADEVYHSFEKERISGIADLYQKGISVNSMSKTFSLPGIRIGWVACSESLCHELKSYRDYTMISAGGINDKIAQLALESSNLLLERNKQILRENLKLLKDWIEGEPGLSFHQPFHVPTTLIKLKGHFSEKEFALDLLKETRTLVVPGSCFGIANHFRIGYACDRHTLEKGLDCISMQLKKEKYSINY